MFSAGSDARGDEDDEISHQEQDRGLRERLAVQDDAAGDLRDAGPRTGTTMSPPIAGNAHVVHARRDEDAQVHREGVRSGTITTIARIQPGAVTAFAAARLPSASTLAR